MDSDLGPWQEDHGTDCIGHNNIRQYNLSVWMSSNLYEEAQRIKLQEVMTAFFKLFAVIFIDYISNNISFLWIIDILFKI